MAGVKQFEDLEVWRKARVLTREIYACTSKGAFAKDFGLRDQMRRAAVSIDSNIAEGFERGGNREFVHFLYLAKGSAAEVRAQLYIAGDLEHLHSAELARLNGSASALARQISALIRYLEQLPAAKRQSGPLEPELSTFNVQRSTP